MGERGSLGGQLRQARRRRFVGRSGEVELLRRALHALSGDGDGEPVPFRVLFLHGPGGVGKTTLIDVLAGVAESDGAAVVRIDARLVAPTRAGVVDALGDRLDGRDRPVLFIDTFELLQPLEDWVRDALLPSLPGGALVVIAGRHPPGARWPADLAWRDLLRVVSLRNLTPEDTRAYLAVEGVPPQLHDHLQVLSHGHPLTLSLLVDAVRRRGPAAVPSSLLDAPDLVGTLLAHVVDAAPSPVHRSALETAAYARFTTEDLLRAVLGSGAESRELFDWLRGLPFVEEGPYGLYPHDLVRDLLDADLRWRDRHGYARLHRRVRAEVLARTERAGTAERLQRVADLMFLARTHPPMARYFERFDMGVDRIDHVQQADRQPILAMTRRHQGPEQAELVEYWMQRQPDAFRVFRGPQQAVAGYAGRLALHEASAADLDRDPGARAMWAYAQRHGAPRPGERVLASRFFLDARYGHGPSASLGLMTVWFMEDVVGQQGWAWDFIGTYEDEQHWAPVMDYIDFGRAPEADYEIGGHRYVVFAHDWRRAGLREWLDRTADHELGLPTGPPHSHVPEVVLSQPEFAAAVRAALRDLHAPDALARNPLVRSRLVRDHADGRDATSALRELITEAAEALRADPREQGFFDVVNRTFLRPAATQERAAEMLHLSFSTYRRHRDRAVARIVERLWRRELHGP
jgi:energy-coupling factor transporter ATP-binding protein EcfA2